MAFPLNRMAREALAKMLSQPSETVGPALQRVGVMSPTMQRPTRQQVLADLLSKGEFVPGPVGDISAAGSFAKNPSVSGLVGLGAAIASPVKLPNVAKRKVKPVLDKERVIDELATVKSLPEVPPDHVRLFRAESPTTKFDDVFDREALLGFAPDRSGEFFTDQLSYADYFRESLGKDAEITFIDVPRSIAESAKVRPGEFVLDIGK